MKNCMLNIKVYLTDESNWHTSYTNDLQIHGSLDVLKSIPVALGVEAMVDSLLDSVPESAPEESEEE